MRKLKLQVINLADTCDIILLGRKMTRELGTDFQFLRSKEFWNLIVPLPTKMEQYFINTCLYWWCNLKANKHE